jgi:hypothetical protein
MVEVSISLFAGAAASVLDWLIGFFPEDSCASGITECFRVWQRCPRLRNAGIPLERGSIHLRMSKTTVSVRRRRRTRRLLLPTPAGC